MQLICWTRQRRSETGDPKLGSPVERQELISKVQHRDQMSSTQLLLLYGSRDHIPNSAVFSGQGGRATCHEAAGTRFSIVLPRAYQTDVADVACMVWEGFFVESAMLRLLYPAPIN